MKDKYHLLSNFALHDHYYLLSIIIYYPTTFTRLSSRAMDIFEVSINYADSTHGGDRRKTSQQCIFHAHGGHCIDTQPLEAHIPCPLSLPRYGCHLCLNLEQRGFLEVEGPARVDLRCGEKQSLSELQNPDPERSLAPHWRAPRFKSPTVS